MNLTKRVRCQIRMDSRWANASAVCMGLSIFLRTVYYFGLVNLNDLDGFSLGVQVVVPMVLAAGYLLVIRGLRINSPILVGGLMTAYAVSGILMTDAGAAGMIAGVVLIAAAVLFVVTGIGYLPNRLPLIAAGAAALLIRFVAVDLMGCILPLAEFHPIAYLPEVSNLLGVAAIAVMCPALYLRPLRRTVELSDLAEAVQEELSQEAEMVPESEHEEAAEEIPLAQELEIPEEAAESAVESDVEAAAEAASEPEEEIPVE